MEMEVGKESQRVFEREPGDANAVVIRAKDPQRAEIRGHLHNVSRTGIGLLLRTPLEVGEAVTIQLRKPSNHVQIQIPGSVCHVEQLDSGRYRVGFALDRALSSAGVYDLQRACTEVAGRESF